MIKFNEYRAFYSSKERDEYNENSHIKPVIHINPDYIVCVEPLKINDSSVWPSSWDASRIYTVKGSWLVEGKASTIAEIISNASRQS